MPRFALQFLAAAILVSASAFAEQYEWGNLRVGGGGYVTGIAIHPTQQDVMYTRTDVGGAYRWDAANQQWIQLLAWVGGSNLIGVDGVAVDANLPNRVYMALGKSSGGDGGLYRSDDRGDSWTRVLTARFEGNGRDLRWAGEPVAVDPHSSNVVYCGTRLDGLWRTLDGSTWAKVTTVPNGYTGTDPTGVRAVVFDPATTMSGRSATIYVGVPGSGIYRSTDGGNSFAAMSGAPSAPRRMQVVNSNLYVTHSTGVALWSGGVWKDITPSAGVGKDYCALAVEPGASNNIVVSQRYSAFNNPMFRSSDTGTTWTQLNTGSLAVNKTREAPWWPSGWWSAATAGMAFDPTRPGHLYYTDWFGVWYSANAWATPLDFTTRVKGDEETVVLTLNAPSSGALVYSGMADVGGFRHESLTDFPTQKCIQKSEGFSIDVCENSPTNIVALDATAWDGTASRLTTSTDRGQTWTARVLPSGTTLGRIAISSTDPNRLVYVAGGGAAYYSANNGASWATCNGAPAGAIGLTDIWNKDAAIAADRVNGNTFYLFKSGFLYASTDGGANWSARNATAIPNKSGWLNLVAAPGLQGDVWVALDANGLYRTTNGGQTFTKNSFFSAGSMIAFGAKAPGVNTPTVFCYGTHSGATGLYRSTDMGVTWIQINDSAHQFQAGAKQIAADRNTFGRVFIATGGCGVLYAQPTSAPPPPPTYVLTVNGGSGGGSYTSGTNVAIAANAAPSGQVFDKWTVSAGSPTIANVNAASTTLTMPVSNVTISATYKAATFTLTVNSGSGGGSYASRANITITANAAPAGQAFDKWTISSGSPTIGNVNASSTTLTMPASNATVSATYKSAAVIGNGTGLRGEYYDNADFTVFKFSRIDAIVDADWSTGSPDASIAADTFSIRWSGQVQAQYSETYTFYTNSDDGVRLWVNGQLLVDNWTDHAPIENSGTIALTAGQKVSIRLDYYENGGGAAIHLFWSSPSTGKNAVPTTQLYPAPANVAPVFSSTPSATPSAATTNDSVAFSGSATDANGDTLTYVWTFGDGTNATGATASHTYGAPGTYTATVTANDNHGGMVTSSVTITVNAPPPPFAVKINFQLAGAPTPSGYLADTGAIFADRGNGYSYGWNVDNSAASRDRNAANSPDQRYDTLIHMQKPENPNASWEIAIPNGSYTVRVVSGDASYFDSVYRLNVEGVLTVNATPTAAQKWTEGTQTVSVGDGKLTISSATGSSNNKICFVEISTSSVAARAVLADDIVAAPLKVGSVRVKMNFGKPGRDGYSVSGTIPDLPADFATASVPLSMDVGAAIVDMTLDAKGRSKSRNGSFQMKHTTTGWQFRAALKNGAWIQNWADGGLLNTTIKSLPAEIPVTLTLGGQTFAGSKTVSYTALVKKSGTAR